MTGSTSKKTTRKKNAKASAWRLSPAAWHRMWITIGWITSLAALAAGLQAVHAYARTIPQPQPTHIEWVDLPAWVRTPANAIVLKAIESAADLSPEDDIRDPALAGRLGQDLERSPWIARVERVTKLPDGTVRVQAAFRQPEAYVNVRGRAYLVDAEGVRLPVDCSAEFIAPAEWLLIEGVDEPLPPTGEQWAGEDLAAALKLVAYLKQAMTRNEVPFAAWLRSVDVANFDRSQRRLDAPLRIRTIDPACYINWGEPPGDEYPVEPPAQRKTDMLRALYAELGRFPSRMLDVRGEDGIRTGRAPGADSHR